MPVEAGQRDIQMLTSLQRDLPRLKRGKPKEGVFAVVGGAPSIKDHLEEIRAADAIICANHVHNWLIERDIVPDYCALFEIVRFWKTGITPHRGVTYLIASQCFDATFDEFAGYPVIMWHTYGSGQANAAIRKMEGDQAPLIAGGSTTIMRGFNIGYQMGWRRFAGIGIDSSFVGQTHVYHNVGGNHMEHRFNGNVYRTIPTMVKQAHDFVKFVKRHDIEIKVHGSGLLPDMFHHEFGD